MKLRLSLIVLAFGLIGACSSSSDKKHLVILNGNSGGGGNGSGGFGLGGVGLFGGGGLGPGNCASGGKTTVSGTVYDPAGVTPLYNVVVYVPKDPSSPPTVSHGPSCDSCSAPVPALSVALSDAAGHFVLEDVPAGTNVPIVMQAGKWRRQTTIPSVVACQDNALTDHETTRLPKNQSEGTLPRIGLTTGNADSLECLLHKIGVDEQEFTIDGSGSVHMYVGCPNGTKYGASSFVPTIDNGATFPPSSQLFDNDELGNYDMLIFSCEGGRCQDVQTVANQAKLGAFEDAGGRVFLDHVHFNWIIRSKLPIQQVGEFGTLDDPSPLTANVDQSFPKGMAFAEWLQNVQATTTPGMFPISKPQRSCQSINPLLAQRWIYADGIDNFYVTINTPVPDPNAIPDGGAPVCGRVVFTDLHVSNDTSLSTVPFPGGCTSTTLTPEEKALEFMIFDLSSCVQKEDQVPEPPPK